MSALERARKRAEGLTYCTVRFDEQGVKRAVWQAPQARRTIPPHLLTQPTTVRQLCCCHSRSFQTDARRATSRRETADRRAHQRGSEAALRQPVCWAPEGLNRLPDAPADRWT